jgi:formylglycine-generating enzyme required for sulfatase activity
VTARSAPAIRDAAIVGVGTLLLLAVTTTILVAPGPPRNIIEPRTRIQLVRLDPGTFEMGSPPGDTRRGDDETPHAVTLTRTVYISRYEVTQAEWAMVMGGNPSDYGPCDGCPVENVDFYQVSEFVSNLNAQTTAMRYRLPTEAEWEFACRAGSTEATESGADPAPAAGHPERVGRRQANPLGLFDMHGNVSEWVNDWHAPYGPEPATDPSGPTAGTRRVIRGGSFLDSDAGSRCAARSTLSPPDRRPSVGFRIVGEPIVDEEGDRAYRD